MHTLSAHPRRGNVAPSQLIVAAAAGSIAAVSINMELMEEDFAS
jgi:hypothetical protein